MIPAALFFWALVFCGLWLSLLPYRFYRIEFIAMTVILTFLMATWMAFGFSLLMPYAYSLPAAMGVFCIGSRWLYGMRRRGHCSWVPLQDELFKNRDWILLTLISTIGLGWLFVSHMCQIRSDGDMYSGGAAWSDLGVHVSQMTYQAQQPQFDTVFPLIYHGKLVYHFLIDWLSSLFLRSGTSIAVALLIPGLSLTFAFVQLSFFLSYRLFRSSVAAALTLYLFLLGGSTVATWLCIQDLRVAEDGAWHNFTHMWYEYTTFWEHNAVFSNFITCALLPQRPVLFGFGVLVLFLNVAVHDEETPTWSGPLLLGFLIGLMPLAQVHAWMMGSCLLASLAIREVYRTRKPGPWTAALLLSALPAAPQFVYLMTAAYHKGYGFFKVGWIMDNDASPLGFWLRNMGPAFILMFVILDVCLHRWRSTRLFTLYLPFVLMFGLCNLYIFQPSGYDNIKLLHMVYYAIALLGAPLLVELFETVVPPLPERGWWVNLVRHGWRPVFVLMVVLVWVVPGMLSIWREICCSDWRMASKNDILFARLIKEKTPVDALFMVPPDNHQPVCFLAGRKVVLGWQGWLESYGLDVKKMEDDEHKVYSGSTDAIDILKKYHVDYLVIEKNRGDEWASNPDFFKDKLHVTYDDDKWAVFRVSPPPPSPSPSP